MSRVEGVLMLPDLSWRSLGLSRGNPHPCKTKSSRRHHFTLQHETPPFSSTIHHPSIEQLILWASDTMSLPVVKTLEQCSDFTKTVLPYIPQLYDLPQQLIQSYNNPTELRNIYLATNPLISALAFSLFLAPLFLIISEINKNYSQVDRCWSILPTVYNAHFAIYAHLSGLPTSRLDNLLAFSTVWSVRMSLCEVLS
jgi:hypothetical protein